MTMDRALRFAEVIGSLGLMCLWGWVAFTIATMSIDAECLPASERAEARVPLTLLMLSGFVAWALDAHRRISDLRVAK